MKPDLNSERLASFNLKNTPFLKGFVLAPPQERDSPLFDKPEGADAALTLRFFRGESELRYTVIKFSTSGALARWDAEMSRSSPAWLSPTKSSLMYGVRASVLGGANVPGLSPPRAAFVGNYAVVVYGFSHQPAGKQAVAKNKELSGVMERVFEELIRRAKTLPPA
jgi:hypothetical protein